MFLKRFFFFIDRQKTKHKGDIDFKKHVKEIIKALESFFLSFFFFRGNNPGQVSWLAPLLFLAVRP